LIVRFEGLVKETGSERKAPGARVVALLRM